MTPDIPNASAALIVCIPGPWPDRSDFLRRIVTLEPMGRYMFAGMILADIERKDHVGLEFDDADPRMAEAFGRAGQGRIPADVLAGIAEHRGVAYLRFPRDLPGQRERLRHFTDIVRRAGGLAVKIESSGTAHDWSRWSELLKGTPFDLYCAGVVLIGGDAHYYSCGMHLFGLPDAEVSRILPPDEAAELLNRFNVWQLDERPVLASGHTFSLAPEAPRYHLEAIKEDRRHDPEDLFHNPHGLWRLDPA